MLNYVCNASTLKCSLCNARTLACCIMYVMQALLLLELCYALTLLNECYGAENVFLDECYGTVIVGMNVGIVTVG